MAVLCGWASIDENGKARGGKAGDQKQTSNTNDTKGEVKLGNWYDFGQTTVWRWKDRTLAKKYAKAIKALCNNVHVGYDQNERVSLYTALKEVNWDYTKLKKDVECDCSELIACGINCAVGKAVISSGVYTGNLDTALKASGYFEKPLTGAKYCDQSEYLATGDISNAPSHHVISALEDGSKYSAGSSGSSSGSSSSSGKSAKVDCAKSKNSSLAGTYKVTVSDYLCLRTGAGTSKDIIEKMKPGEKVQCYGYYTTVSGTKWLLVVHGKNTGFCSKKYLKKC